VPRAATLSKSSGRVGRRAASFVAWSRSLVRPRRWERVCSSAVARRLLRRGIFAAGGPVVGRRRTRRSSRGIRCRALVATSDHGGWRGRAPRWSRGVCCRAVSAVCAAESFGRGRRVAGARLLFPYGRGSTCGQGIVGGRARPRSRGVCCRAVSAPREVKSLGEGERVGGCAASSAARTRCGGR